jgi:hypothetical protein
MKIYVLIIFSDDCGPGSKPSIQCEIFRDPFKRLLYKKEFVYDRGLVTKDDDIYTSTFGGDWKYWFEEYDKTI